mmetsp:Transcript_1555/g.5122  ORF Transcript_1555/g.5122 Transcript_1555/m.5122 type:complete len:223 (+) Transcript_1555:3475-4143(+)
MKTGDYFLDKVGHDRREQGANLAGGHHLGEDLEDAHPDLGRLLSDRFSKPEGHRFEINAQLLHGIVVFGPLHRCDQVQVDVEDFLAHGLLALPNSPPHHRLLTPGIHVSDMRLATVHPDLSREHFASRPTDLPSAVIVIREPIVAVLLVRPVAADRGVAVVHIAVSTVVRIVRQADNSRVVDVRPETRRIVWTPEHAKFQLHQARLDQLDAVPLIILHTQPR